MSTALWLGLFSVTCFVLISLWVQDRSRLKGEIEAGKFDSKMKQAAAGKRERELLDRNSDRLWKLSAARREAQGLRFRCGELEEEIEALRERLAQVGSGIPLEVAQTVVAIGRAQWSETEPQSAEVHGEGMAQSVRLTAEHFGQGDEPQKMQFLTVEGTDTVIAYVGTSPHSGLAARGMTSAWNLLWEHSKAMLERGVVSLDAYLLRWWELEPEYMPPAGLTTRQEMFGEYQTLFFHLVEAIGRRDWSWRIEEDDMWTAVVMGEGGYFAAPQKGLSTLSPDACGMLEALLEAYLKAIDRIEEDR